jgi:YgiT-type zinc finger domain-containing protein
MGFNVHEAQTIMKCVICKDGQTSPGHATITLERSGVTLVVKDVPADICDVCGEKYLAEEIAAALREKLEAAEQLGQDVQIRSFAA